MLVTFFLLAQVSLNPDAAHRFNSAFANGRPARRSIRGTNMRKRSLRASNSRAALSLVLLLHENARSQRFAGRGIDCGLVKEKGIDV